MRGKKVTYRQFTLEIDLKRWEQFLKKFKSVLINLCIFICLMCCILFQILSFLALWSPIFGLQGPFPLLPYLRMWLSLSSLPCFPKSVQTYLKYVEIIMGNTETRICDIGGKFWRVDEKRWAKAFILAEGDVEVRKCLCRSTQRGGKWIDRR